MCCCAFTYSKYADAHICVQNKYCVEPHALHCFCLLSCWPASQYGFYTCQTAALVLKTNVPTLPLKMASLGRNTWNSPNLVTWRFRRRPRCSRGLISVKKALTRTCELGLAARDPPSKPGSGREAVIETGQKRLRWGWGSLLLTDQWINLLLCKARRGADVLMGASVAAGELG